MENQPWEIELGELDKKMGVEVIEQSPERVVATMPVSGNTQSFGLLHGGAMACLAEAVGSWAAVIHASTLGKVAVGVDLNATHHASGREGLVTATATAIWPMEWATAPAQPAAQSWLLCSTRRWPMVTRMARPPPPAE